MSRPIVVPPEKVKEIADASRAESYKKRKQYVKKGITLNSTNGSVPEELTMLRINEVAKLISKGKSRATCIEYIMNTYDLAYNTAKNYYVTAIKSLYRLDDDVRKGLIQANIDRLEKIIESCIEGNSAEKKVARECITELNKMLGVTSQNTVMINKNDEGDEQIIISFDKG